MTGGHWQGHARQWDLVVSPLRPAPEDLALFQQAVAEHRNDGPCKALLLGVTPEIAGMSWRTEDALLAVDLSPGMIGGVWPGDSANRSALCADWLALPVPDQSFDLVIGDGSLAALRFPAQWRQMLAELCRVLRRPGRLVVRVFTQAEPGETVDQVLDDLAARRIGNFSTFKWRLAMALQAGSADGVEVSEVHRAFHHAGLSAAGVADAQGWPLAVVHALDVYRDAKAVYTFPSADEVRRMLEERFRVTRCDWPGYELGERCPVMVCDMR